MKPKVYVYHTETQVMIVTTLFMLSRAYVYDKDQAEGDNIPKSDDMVNGNGNPGDPWLPLSPEQARPWVDRLISHMEKLLKGEHQ